MGVGPHEGHLLALFGMEVRQGFGRTCYQVGSSLTQKSGWRDVDVRLILPDDEYAGYFGDPFTPDHQGRRPRAPFGADLRQRRGLPSEREGGLMPPRLLSSKTKDRA